MNKFPIKIVSTQEENALQIRFFPTDICNYNCSYCWPGTHDGKFRYPKNVDLVIKNFRSLLDLYSAKLNKSKFHLVIAGGGEPTLWPGLEKFCKEIKETHSISITIVTNGSRTINWWETNASYFDSVNLSCHHEFVDIDHYINVADALFGRGIKVSAFMLMDARHWDKCVSLIESMKTSRYPWYIQTKEIVDAPGQGVDVYTPDQIAYINDSIKRLPDSSWILKRLADMKLHESIVLFNDDTAVAARPHTIITNGWNKFKGWKCNVGLESIAIDPSGLVISSCQLPVFGNRQLNLFSETFEVESVSPNSITCTLNDCNCQPDTHVTKSLP